MSTTSPEIRKYLKNLSEELGTEPPIYERINGPTEAYTIRLSGENYSEIHMDPSNYTEIQKAEDTYRHEATHVIQNQELEHIKLSSKENESLKPLLEGQADYNSGKSFYKDAEELYTEFIVNSEAMDPGKALEKISEKYAFSNARVEAEKDGVTEKVRIPVKIGRDGSHHLSSSETRMLLEKNYLEGDKIKDLDLLRTMPIDYRDEDIDSQKLGVYLLEVQGKLEENY